MGDVQNQIRQYIAQGELEKAVSLLSELWKDSPQLDAVLLESSKLSSLNQQIRRGTIFSEHAEVTRNQLSERLLQLVSEIDLAARFNPIIKSELEAFHLKQTHSGSGHNIGRISGDFVQGDKVAGDKVAGDKFVHNDHRQYSQTNFRFELSMVLDSIFNFFGDLVNVCLHPIRFLEEAATTFRSKASPFVRSLLFLVLCVLVAICIEAITPSSPTTLGEQFLAPPQTVWGKVGEHLLTFIWFILSGLIVYLAWRIIGKKWNAVQVLTKSNYLFGGILVLLSIALLIGNSLLSIDPAVVEYKQKLNQEKQGLDSLSQYFLDSYARLSNDSMALSSKDKQIIALFEEKKAVFQQADAKLGASSLYSSLTLIVRILILLCLAWFVWAWNAYRDKQTSLGASLGALSISTFGFFILMLFSELIDTGRLLNQQAFNSSGLAALNDKPSEETTSTLVSKQAQEIINMNEGKPCKVKATILDKEGLNLRESPSLKSAVLIAIPYETEIVIVKKELVKGKPKAFWAKTYYKGKIGWLWGQYLEIPES